MKRVLSIVVLAVCAFSAAQKGPMQQGGGKEVSKAQLAKLDKEYKAAEAAYKKAPKDKKVVKKYADASFALGMGTMVGEGLTPREKYTGALKYLRRSVKADPKNKLAKEQIEMIESIYKSMGRPIPVTD